MLDQQLQKLVFAFYVINIFMLYILYFTYIFFFYATSYYFCDCPTANFVPRFIQFLNRS